MFYMKSSFILVFVVFYIELSIFEEILTYAISSQKSQYDEDQQMIKAVQDSIVEWKLKKAKHRHKRQANVVCYGELGCFEDSGPYGYIDMLPSSPEEIDTKFYVYSTKNRSENPFLQFSFHDISPYSLLNETLTTTTTQNPLTNNRIDRQDRNVRASSSNNKSTFDPVKVYKKFGDMNNASMRIIVHGFGSNCRHEWIDEMRAALMAVEECFVMCVEWEKGALLPNYVKAAANTRLVGKQLAFLLKGLEKNNGLNYTRVHIIGFSLGAHASGFAGAELKRIQRITGLDPAGPLFEGSHIAARLDESDAEFVDVIHSNGENLILGGLGSWQPMGHVDFYPNGGKIQHGCSNLFLGAVTDIIWTSSKENEGRSLCNHRRAYKFFIDSVAPRCLFPAFPCESYESYLKGNCFHCPNRKAKSIKSSASSEIKIHDRVDSICGAMGYYADKSTGRGQLYLRTREEEPFCAHQYKIKLHNSITDLPIRTIGRIDIELESEGGLSETFTITDRDDQEIFAGDFISKIIVPHPALNFPKNLTITYHVYRGWLTRGLSSWSVNKVILSDSFGESFSLCKNIELESGIPVRLTLQEGDCYEEELLLAAIMTEPSTTTDSIELSPSETAEALNGENLAMVNKTGEVIELGKHMIIKKNESATSIIATSSEKSISVMSADSWKPIKINSLNDSLATSNSTNSIDEDKFLNIGEKMPKAKTEKRSFGQSGDDSDQPIRDDSTAVEEPNDINAVEMNETDSNDENIKELIDTENDTSDKFVTVQLFPYRLGDIFERAEKYAKYTLFPLLSEQISNIFSFDGKNEKANNNNNASPQMKTMRKFDVEDDESALSMEKVQTLQKMSIKSDSIRPPIEKLLNTNYDLKEDDEMESVRINLPTYKPPRDSDKIFIPIDRGSV
ncbi:unnamed protein product [Chironomus riparius]|uniref:Lipase domain-containing protein n=1 Tax=Chironomus riparius TaxID=315576 RepID=A0A9N9RLU5_9DIPT|nr:unnamed protein product [Chironomus riparius]